MNAAAATRQLGRGGFPGANRARAVAAVRPERQRRAIQRSNFARIARGKVYHVLQTGQPRRVGREFGNGHGLEHVYKRLDLVRRVRVESAQTAADEGVAFGWMTLAGETGNTPMENIVTLAVARGDALRLLKDENAALRAAISALTTSGKKSHLDRVLERVVTTCKATTAAMRANPDAFR